MNDNLSWYIVIYYNVLCIVVNYMFISNKLFMIIISCIYITCYVNILVYNAYNKWSVILISFLSTNLTVNALLTSDAFQKLLNK